MKKLDQIQIKALNDQIRVSITQGLLQVLGPDNAVRFTEGTVTVDQLQPGPGLHLTIKAQLDVYPKPIEPSKPA